MSKVRVNGFSISIDGYGAGPDQSLDNPLGIGGEELHEWLTTTRTFHEMSRRDGGTTGPDDDLAARSMANVGAWILGRNMFTASRGPWAENDSWRGWWGVNPPYHAPVFVLTQYPRDSIEMEGGTTFHFLTNGIHSALERAKEASEGLDIRVLGGVGVIRQYLQARLIDEAHLAIAPRLLGRGEHLLRGIDLPALGYGVTERVATPNALHVILTKA
jgi:dihydrofolate reductase